MCPLWSPILDNFNLPAVILPSVLYNRYKFYAKNDLHKSIHIVLSTDLIGQRSMQKKLSSRHG
jgi:hypothetical protein